MSSLQPQLNNLAKWSIRLLLIACAIVLLLDAKIDTHPHFPIEHSYAFYPWYGFISSLTLILASKAIRLLLNRDEDYYDK